MVFRKMRRFKQQLNNEECESILRAQKRGVLAVLGDGGYPYAVPLNFVYDNGCIYFHSAVEGHKLDAIRSCDKGSFNVLGEPQKADDGWSYFFDSVTAFGRLREVTDTVEKTDHLRQLGNKYFPDTAMTESDIQKNGGRCAVIELKIEHMTGKHVHER
ncbi:pyridoxamine 5'-phosphate oxidase family protein [Ruminococcus sp.]|uniref:pyridoxamine 5'-phosphate oxidase family protein n=1 Tax=Ruminococcus sp. TaxID=41978 RepID=UPI00386E4301